MIGRPSTLTDERVKQAQKLAKLGATDAEIAEFFEVAPVTIWRWKEANENFCSALKVGKEHADNRVERSLFSRATGYSHPAVKMFMDGKTGEVIREDYVEHYPPDTTACIFWLKNRRPDLWRAQPLEGEDTPTPVRVVVEVKDASRPEGG
jgi:hypothetical protein